MLSENGFSDMGPKIRFLCYQKRPFLIRHFLIKFSNSPILLENPDFLTGCGYQKMLLEKDFNSYRMTVRSGEGLCRSGEGRGGSISTPQAENKNTNQLALVLG